MSMPSMAALRVELAAEDLRLRKEMSDLANRLEANRSRRKQIAEALAVRVELDRDALVLAAGILVCRGTINECRRGVILDAKDAILSGGGKLRHNYFGTKNYDRWSDQREDHEYGRGPAHGYTVFSVGLGEAARKRDLTSIEVEACIYALDCIGQGLLDGKQLETISREFSFRQEGH